MINFASVSMERFCSCIISWINTTAKSLKYVTAIWHFTILILIILLTGSERAVNTSHQSPIIQSTPPCSAEFYYHWSIKTEQKWKVTVMYLDMAWWWWSMKNLWSIIMHYILCTIHVYSIGWIKQGYEGNDPGILFRVSLWKRDKLSANILKTVYILSMTLSDRESLKKI